MHKARVPILIALVLQLAGWAFPAFAGTDELLLETGESRVLEVGSVSRVAIGDPRVADVRVLSKHEIMVVAKGDGGTTLHIWDKDSQSARQILVFPRESRPLADTITQAIGIPGITARMAGTQLVLSGDATTEQVHLQALATAEGYGRPLVDLIHMVEPPAQIRVKVRIVETSSETVRDLGVDWQSVSPDDATDRSGVQGVVAAAMSGHSADRILQKVKALVNDGKAKLLAEPDLVAISGTTASFLSGGEIPVPIVADGETSVQWKPYGVSLQVTPRLDATGQIDVKVHPEVSSLDWSSTASAAAGVANGMPAVRRRYADTELRVTPGATIVIAGLVQTEESETVSKLPVFGDLPLFGNLFRATRRSTRQTELMVVMTPSLYDGKAEGGAVN